MHPGIRPLEDWGLALAAPENQATSELIMFATISVLVNQAVDLAAAWLLIAGAVRLRRVRQDQGVRGRT